MNQSYYSPPNYRAALDAGSASCYISSVIGPARVSAERWAQGNSPETRNL
jgi:hypothetical protein